MRADQAGDHRGLREKQQPVRPHPAQQLPREREPGWRGAGRARQLLSILLTATVHASHVSTLENRVEVVHSRGVRFTQFLVWRIGWRGVARQVLGDRADERDRTHQRPRGAELPLLGDGTMMESLVPPHSLRTVC